MPDTSLRQLPAILAIGTAVPPYRVEQAALAHWMIKSLDYPRGLSTWLDRLYNRSGITTRYSCLPDADYPPEQSRWGPHRTFAEAPTTAERMVIYEREATDIAVAAGAQAIADASARTNESADDIRASITHVIAVSCTGFFAPGIDQQIVRGLALPIGAERTIIGFMGCAAAFNALRTAHHIVSTQPAARVLIVCVELCTIHIQPGVRPVNLVVASLFSDGAAACIVGQPTAQQRTAGDYFAIQRLHTELSPATEDFMVWRIGDHGYTLALSTQIPESIAEVAPRGLARLLPTNVPQPAFWAIHPGGRAIVERLAELFELPPDALAPSYSVLRDYGNMSSPTVLFVLHKHRDQLRRTAAAPSSGVAMAFGPGLVTEMAYLTYVPPA